MKDASFATAIVVLIFLSMALLTSLYHCIRGKRIEKDINHKKHRYWKHWFEGIRPRFFPQAFTLTFFARRTILAVLVFICADLNMKTKIIGYSILQWIYFLFHLAQRPFEATKDQILEIVNELFYCFLVWFLIHYNSESKWTDSLADAYIWIMISNNAIFLLITIGKDLINKQNNF